MTKRLEVGDVSYQFQIWDTAGQEKVGIARTAKNKIIKKKRTTRQETLFIILSMYMYLSIRINFLIVIKIYSFVLTYINNFIENCIPVEKSK